MSATKPKEQNPYSHTVNLPKTEFPMRGDLPKREPQWLELWEKERVYEKSLARGEGDFVLHDGPPYANGHTHIGHALNKILKDMVVKSRALAGKRTPYRPGWDCHGLPIEHALLKELKMSKRGVKDVAAFRRQAAEFAERFIGIQREEFKRLGVLGEWDRPYKTMSRDYEASILDAFRRLYAKGYIYKGLKTVSWCVTCETALAEAEVEYKEKTSPSVYVALPVLKGPKELLESRVAVWTTTPWTLPANMAVAFHPDLKYALVDGSLLVAEARIGALKKGAHDVVARWSGRQLVEAGLVCERPFGGESKAVLADYVTAEDGTGIVHTAPGHGVDDFSTGKANGLEILCPVDGAGRYTDRAPEFLRGKQIFEEGNPAVVAALREGGRLLAEEKVTHSYPHCWRCKNPIAFRATEQWFLGVGHEGLRERLLAAIGETEWHPAAGEARIAAMVKNRPDWCVSRQRLWGTPIPILYCLDCGKEHKSDAALKAIADRVREQGSDFWFEDQGKPVSWDFLGACACGGKSFRRETDILDVWVDSGASWLAVLGEGNTPCDLYLEGSDQHRGWFQSSLVLAAALTGKAPYKAVLTHGFVLDDKGRAMHKSAGNVVSPQEVIAKHGADVLRLWVALADYSDDVRISDKLLEVPIEAYRKLRNTFRYLMGNVCDFDPGRDAAAYAKLPELERYMLKRLFDLDAEVRAAYEAYQFRKAATALVDFCNLELSAFYLDARKDALYTLKTADPLRRAAQTAMWECLARLLRLASPMISFTAEEAWQHLPEAQREGGSVFLSGLSPAPKEWDDSSLLPRWRRSLALRQSVLASLEVHRAQKTIGASLQAKVVLGAVDDELHRFLKKIGEEAWAELCIVSAVEIRLLTKDDCPDCVDPVSTQKHADGPSGQTVYVTVEKAAGAKCARCWRYPGDVGADASKPDLCARCARQLA